MVWYRAFAGLRRVSLVARSLAMRFRLRLAYRGIRCHPSVRFGRGVTVQAFDGGQIDLGPGCLVQDHAVLIAKGGRIAVAANSQIGHGSVVVSCSDISIGEGVLIAEHVTIRDQDHGHEADLPLGRQGLRSAPVRIGDHVWIAAKVTVTRGVEIAEHAVVGANAVVTRSLTERGVYAGVPARLIGSLERNEGVSDGA